MREGPQGLQRSPLLSYPQSSVLHQLLFLRCAHTQLPSPLPSLQRRLKMSVFSFTTRELYCCAQHANRGSLSWHFRWKIPLSDVAIREDRSLSGAWITADELRDLCGSSAWRARISDLSHAQASSIKLMPRLCFNHVSKPAERLERCVWLLGSVRAQNNIQPHPHRFLGYIPRLIKAFVEEDSAQTKNQGFWWHRSLKSGQDTVLSGLINF